MEINFFFFLFLKINVFNLFSFKLELFLNEIKICLLLVLQLISLLHVLIIRIKTSKALVMILFYFETIATVFLSCRVNLKRLICRFITSSVWGFVYDLKFRKILMSIDWERNLRNLSLNNNSMTLDLCINCIRKILISVNLKFFWHRIFIA